MIWWYPIDEKNPLNSIWYYTCSNVLKLLGRFVPLSQMFKKLSFIIIGSKSLKVWVDWLRKDPTNEPIIDSCVDTEAQSEHLMNNDTFQRTDYYENGNSFKKHCFSGFK